MDTYIRCNWRRITQALKFIFEHTLPNWQLKKATRVAIQKYELPINQAANALYFTIDRGILGKSSMTYTDDEKFQILYSFGCFLGWVQIFLDEIFYEGIDIPDVLKKKPNTAKYQFQLELLLSRIGSSIVYSNPQKILESNFPPRYVLSAIGGIMIDKSSSNDSFKKIININEFIQKCRTSEDFKAWFQYLENMLTDIHISKYNPQRNMLNLIKFYRLCLFSENC